ncbi:MAG: hypothetical protein ABEI74_01240 [Candidatus Pacearchaeota archaeon]
MAFGDNFKFDASFFLRLGLAFAFLYAGIDSLINPQNWIGFIPQFVANIIDPKIFLDVFSVFEIVLGVWLLSAWRSFEAAIVSALVLAGMTLTNLSLFNIIFRDISLVFAAIGLAVLEREK